MSETILPASPTAETRHHAAHMLRGTDFVDGVLHFEQEPLSDAPRARAVLKELKGAPAPTRATQAYGAYALLRALTDSGSPEVRATLVAEGVPALDALAGRLDPASLAWGTAMHALAVIGTPQSLGRWADRFVGLTCPRRASLSVASAALLCGEAGQEASLPDRVEAALSCPARKPYVEALTAGPGRPPGLPAETAKVSERVAAVVAWRAVGWWPAGGKRRHLYLVRQRLSSPGAWGTENPFHDVIGAGTLLCSEGTRYRAGDWRTDDCFAGACLGELENRGLVSIDHVSAEMQPEYETLLDRWRGAPLSGARVVRFAEVSARLRIHVPPVAVAEACQGVEAGWAVFDGEYSAWHPRSNWRPETGVDDVLRVHLGRRLLGIVGAM